MKRFDKSTGLICTQKLASFFHHHAAALRTLLCGRFLPGHEITIRIILTSVVLTSFFCFLKHNLFSTFRTCHPDLLKIWFGIFAFRKSRTCKESSMRTIFDHHMSATVFADHICHFILNINLFKFFLCSIYILLQIRIEVAYYCLPL